MIIHFYILRIIMPDGIVFDRSSYNKGDLVTITVTDSSRAAIPAIPDSVEEVTASAVLSTGQVVNTITTVKTPGAPAVPAKAPGTISVTGGRVAAMVPNSDTGTVVKYTFTA